MTRPTIELSEFPIVRITFHMDTSLEDIAAHREAFLQLFAKRGPVLTIADINMVRRSSATPIHRKAIAETADALAKRGGFIAEFIVVRSAFLRRLVTAYSWIRGSKTHPLRCFASEEEALVAARELLRQRETSP